MTNKLYKRPQQLSFSFMQEFETVQKINLSLQERNELIQALAELILTYPKNVKFINVEVHDEH